MIWRSFTDPGPETYRIFVDNSLYAKVLWTTLRMSAIVTGASLLLGYPYAYIMLRAGGEDDGGPGRSGPIAVLVEHPRAHLRVDGAAAGQRCDQLHPAAAAPHRRTALAHAQRPGSDHRHESYPAAVHGVPALRRDASHRPRPRAGRRELGGATFACLHQSVLAAQPARRLRGRPARVRSFHRLLHHACPSSRQPVEHDVQRARGRHG